MSSTACHPCQPSAILSTHNAPVRHPKRFTITRQLAKLNKPRVTVTDNTACITSSYSHATAQELVKELASVLGMLACTQEDVMDMLREAGQKLDRL